MRKKKNAFTLVELSIVLVILGLLVGGVLSGQSLIRAAELRAVNTEYNNYFTSVQSFRDKYFAIPGDMKDATRFWGKDNTNCPAQSGTAAAKGTCNGDGNGRLEFPTATNVTSEPFQFWKQLSLAGLIEGSYTGISGPTDYRNAILGENAPASKLKPGGWGVRTVLNYPGDTKAFALDYGNAFTFGGQIPGDSAFGSILTPTELWNIDTKMDDGSPYNGRIVAMNWSTCTTATSNTDSTAQYKVQETSKACALHGVNNF